MNAKVYVQSDQLSVNLIQDIIDHFAVMNASCEPFFEVCLNFFAFLNPCRVKWNVVILMRTQKCNFFEPFESFLLGKFIQETFLNILVVSHRHLFDRSAFFHGI